MALATEIHTGGEDVGADIRRVKDSMQAPAGLH